MKVFRILFTFALILLGLYLATLAPILAIIDLLDNWSLLSTGGKAWDILLIAGREFLAGIVFVIAWFVGMGIGTD